MEKSYVLGKGSAEASGGALRVRITGDHSRATTMSHALRVTGLDRPRSVRAGTPLSMAGAWGTGPPGGDPRRDPGWLPGCAVRTERRRSWSIPGLRTRGFVTR
ncbi:hypothetical protein EF909_21060 [Streptomyces sp. WAC01280]|nr:hypothetical protein EF909_21060 [Streptomyces sp. WAC01280]